MPGALRIGRYHPDFAKVASISAITGISREILLTSSAFFLQLPADDGYNVLWGYFRKKPLRCQVKKNAI